MLFLSVGYFIFFIFSRLHEQLMDLQQKQIDELGSWLISAEAKIEGSASVGSDTETVERQIEDHKVIVNMRLM